MATTSRDVFSTLSTELLISVVGESDRATLAALCLVSKTFNRVYSNALYQRIDLSVHRSDLLSTAEQHPHGNQHGTFPRLECPLTFLNRKRTALDDEIWHRQQLLLRTLALVPQHAKQTHELIWTVLESQLQTRSDAIAPPDKFESSQDDTLLWQAFTSMSNLRTVDISWQRKLRETSAIVPSLFPSVLSVAIGGLASHRFVSAIVQTINPRTLHRLELNNLQQMGDPDPLPQEALNLTELSVYCANNPHVTVSGIMRGHLDSLIGNLPALRTLIIRTWSPMKSYGPINSALERSRFEVHIELAYADWTRLIRSVAHQLEVFHFEQGPSPGSLHKWPRSGPGRIDNSVPKRGRFMDRCFAEYIFHAILDCGWPELRRMSLFGFKGCNHKETYYTGRRTTKDLEPCDLPELLTHHLGPAVEIAVDPDNGNRFESNTFATGIPGFKGYLRRADRIAV